MHAEALAINSRRQANGENASQLRCTSARPIMPSVYCLSKNSLATTSHVLPLLRKHGPPCPDTSSSFLFPWFSVPAPIWSFPGPYSTLCVLPLPGPHAGRCPSPQASQSIQPPTASTFGSLQSLVHKSLNKCVRATHVPTFLRVNPMP